MAGGQERILRRRISSVQSTKKITHAMELIAATRVVKAQQRAKASHPYAEKITSIIEDLASHVQIAEHPLLRSAENPKHEAIIVITSDRGLAGPYNTAAIRAGEQEIADCQRKGVSYEIITIGKKAKDYFSFRGYKIEQSFEGISDNPNYEDARRISHLISQKFIDLEIDKVIMVYTEFISLGLQNPVAVRLLPFVSLEKIATHAVETEKKDDGNRAAFEFEPSSEGVLEVLLNLYLDNRLFTALLDSAASEHASRQRAMKAATDNAEDLIIALTRTMNRARQDSITTEIMEIVGGAEALMAGKE